MTSNAEMARLLDALELLLGDEVPDGTKIEAWRKAFDAAAEQAEREPGWDAVVARAKALEARLRERLAALEERKARLEVEFRSQGTGARALKGYGSVLKG